jgi:hypothetical protein
MSGTTVVEESPCAVCKRIQGDSSTPAIYNQMAYAQNDNQ